MLSFISNPLYNGLIAIVSVVPGNDIGVAIILFTILVKLALFPLSKKATLMQIHMKELEPRMAEIKIKYANNKEEQGRQTMALYKERKINPLSSFGVIIIQIIIVIALYRIFYSGGLPVINLDIIYSFLLPFASAHKTIDMVSFGFLNLAETNIFLALLAGGTQFIQARLMAGKNTPTQPGAQGFGADFAKTMQTQTMYVFPALMVFIAWKSSGAVALYLLISNLMSIAQEYYLRKHRTPIVSPIK